ncbi:X-ray repair cross-complementing protein 5 isoform X2 [Cardiocondyla obscurior]
MNVGIVRHGTQSSSQLLDKQKFILKHIIQKKIFLRPKDEVGVILMGSDSSKSDSVTGLDNVQELCKMQVGNWDLIKKIEKLNTTNLSCSWMEAIYAAIEYIKHECVDNNERKIILLSTFNEEKDIVDQFEAEDIVKKLNEKEIFFIAIGERALDDIDEESETASEALLRNVLQQVNGQNLSFEQAMLDVRFYKRPSTKPRPWSCSMELGDFSIPIIGISKMMNEVKLPNMVQKAKISTLDVTDQEISIKSIAEWTDNNKTIYTEEDIIRSYVYGGKAIPVSEEAKASMTQNSNKKCYKIHGFTARENVPMEYWLSNGTYVIVPATESGSVPFYSLVQAMVDKNVVAIVEKVYRNNLEPNMVALFPSIDVPNEWLDTSNLDTKLWCFIEIALPFEQDYVAIIEKPLKFVNNELSKEQSDAVDELLSSLELPKATATNGCEKYLPGFMPEPGTQHMWDTLAARALHPDKPLPPIADDVLNLLEQPEFLKEKCKPVAEKIKNLFLLEKKEPLYRNRKKLAEMASKQSDADNDVFMTQTVKKEKKDTTHNDSDKSKNNELFDDCDFNVDEIDNI